MHPFFNSRGAKGVEQTKQSSKSTKGGVQKRAAASKRSMVQMYLDVGQKDFAPVRCATCGMHYQKGSHEDEKAHELHHREFRSDVDRCGFKGFQGWATERVVSDEGSEGGRTILVTAGDSAAQTKKVEIDEQCSC